jgi:hypothetical protein
MVSEARLAANRRNAQKSTGPKTQSGKDKSRFNALDHGCRAKMLVLPEEDSQAIEARRVAWSATLSPENEIEAHHLQEAVVNSWQLDRIRRSQTARLTANILNHGVDRDEILKQEVSDLGRRLFTDRVGPTMFYPSPIFGERSEFYRKPSTSFAGNQAVDPDRPANLVLLLQSTLLGCEWMLGEWVGLKAILEKGQHWLSSDKLKAVRLLGKQPCDAIGDSEVALVFLASHALKADNSSWDWEISVELADVDMKRFRKYAAARELESLMPQDADLARKALVGIVERATEQLTSKAAVHNERARVEKALVPDILAFDDSNEGERLRRYELACGRAMSRSLDNMLKVRKFVSGPLSVVSCQVEGTGESDATNEPNDHLENATNEPNGYLENSTNEPNDAGEIVTNVPKLSADSGRGDRAEQSATTIDRDHGYHETQSDFDMAKSAERLQAEIAQVAARRAQRLRELNEQARKAAEFEMASRRARIRERKTRKTGVGGQPVGVAENSRFHRPADLLE